MRPTLEIAQLGWRWLYEAGHASSLIFTGQPFARQLTMKKRAGSAFSRGCRSFAVLIFAVTVLDRCGAPGVASNQVLLTVQTEPQGAMLYSNGAALGMAPQTWVYTPDAQGQAAGWIQAANVTAIWPSGAKTETSVRLVMHQGPQVITMSRPPDAPGLDVDMAHAVKLQQTKTAQDGADAQALHDAAENLSTQRQTTTHTDCDAGGNTVDCRRR